MQSTNEGPAACHVCAGTGTVLLGTRGELRACRACDGTGEVHTVDRFEVRARARKLVTARGRSTRPTRE